MFKVWWLSSIFSPFSWWHKILCTTPTVSLPGTQATQKQHYYYIVTLECVFFKRRAVNLPNVWSSLTTSATSHLLLKLRMLLWCQFNLLLPLTLVTYMCSVCVFTIFPNHHLQYNKLIFFAIVLSLVIYLNNELMNSIFVHGLIEQILYYYYRKCFTIHNFPILEEWYFKNILNYFEFWK